MDVHFDTTVCSSSKEFLDWILNRTGGQDVLAVSTHMVMLEELRDAKRENRDRDLLNQILFAHLDNPDPNKHREFLEQPDAWQKEREKWHIEAVLDNYARVYQSCKDLADVTINTPDLGLEGMVKLIAALRDAMLASPLEPPVRPALWQGMRE